jgi:anti-anti-sigma factor
MAEVLLRTRLSRYGAVETLYVSGELDIATKRVFERAVRRALDGQGGEFFIDLSGLTFMDSSGANALLAMYQRIKSIGRRLVVISPSPQVHRVLETLGLEQVLEIRSKPTPGDEDLASAGV